jgi:amidase
MMRSPIDPFTPAVELAAAIRRKEVSPVEVVDCYLERMDQLDGRLNAFCHRADDDVRKAASAAADAVVRAASTEDLPPFHGVPLPIKDLLDVAGWPTTHGSAGGSQAPVAVSDPVVQRFVDAGFVLLGKTTTSESGTVPFTENETLGVSRNPWDPDRTPGGSSSGAGAAVAAGMAPIAHAEDGGGSIRIPASCNGLVGLKPTRGLVTNVTVDVEGLATSGVLTRSVTDTAAALDVLARHDPAAWWSPPTPQSSFASAVTLAAPTGLRIGVLADSPIDGLSVDPACAAAVDAALRTLESVGHDVVDTPLPLPPPDELIAAFTTIWNVGGAGIALADPDRVEPHNRALRDAARAIDSWAYAEGVRKTPTLVAGHRRSLRYQLRPPRHTHHGMPPATRGRLADRHRRRSPHGPVEQLSDGGVHVAVQRHRPTGDISAHPPRRRHRPARRRTDCRRTMAGRSPPPRVSHPRARTSLDRSPPGCQLRTKAPVARDGAAA